MAKIVLFFPNLFVAFCPVHCGPEELHCAAPWIDGKQTAADYCMPMKIGECWNHCPVQCDPDNDQVCPGGKDHATGCEHSGFCHPQDCKYYFIRFIKYKTIRCKYIF